MTGKFDTKIMTEKKDLQTVADDFFTRYPKENKVFITDDGQAFIEDQFAKNHAKDKDLDVKPFRRGVEEIFDASAASRNELEKYITSNVLDIAFTAETTVEDLRKQVIDAIAALKKKNPKTEK